MSESTEATEILRILKSEPGAAFSVKEISKKVDRKKYHENPSWARPILEGMVAQHKINKDDGGHYRSINED
jgi:predicted transcriptional regulator